MLGRFIKDESGIAMGLAVIMIVLIGVMGAGLLVFVRNDLEAVVEVNQGQKAFDIADSGVQAARQRIAEDKEPTHYDIDDGTSCDASGDGAAPTPNWAPGGGGVTRSFGGGGGQFTITIQWLHQDPNPLAEQSCIAPETDSTPDPGVDYFRVISTGTYGNAKRRVEAIYRTESLNLPQAYLATDDITIKGDTTRINNVSLFVRGDINNLRPDDPATSGNEATLQGEDLAYGDWNRDPYNVNLRPGTLTIPSNRAGAGALGTITYKPDGEPYGNNKQKAGDAGTAQRYGKVDFDSSSKIFPAPSYNFVPRVWADPSSQPADAITFPFDTTRKIDIEFLRDLAISQGNYHSVSGGSTVQVGTTGSYAYPDPSSPSTVYFMEFTGSSKGKVDFKVNTGGPDPAQGTIVVVNGDLSTSSSSNGFAGPIIIRDPDLSDTTEMLYENLGEFKLNGFVNVEGDAVIGGSVTPLLTQELLNRPGFYGVSQWSWRELYE